MDNEHFSFKRVIAAVVTGLIGCAAIWVLVPYNNFYLQNTYIADSFLPESVVALMLLLVLFVNPLLRLCGSKWMFTSRQLALVCSMMLLAAIIPSNGLMRMFPRFVAQMSIDFNGTPTTSQLAAQAGLRQALFPDPLPTVNADGSIKTYDTPVSDQFVDELAEGASLPWKAWIKPMTSWGMLIMALWAMMIGLAGVVYPQWRDNERLPFPLLNVYQAIIGDPDEDSGRAMPSIFYSRSFWIACTIVFIIHAFRGLNVFTSAFPSFPLDWDLSPYYTDGIMRFASAAFRKNYIFFTVVGVAYFIPNRYSVSIWAWVFFYSWYSTLGRAYIPAFDEGQVEPQAFGILLSIAIWVLWLGRGHWAQVGRAMFGKAGNSAEARRNSIAGWILMLGLVGIIFWLYWAGCSLWWSVVAGFGSVIVSLVMARIIAETGLPALWTSRISIAGINSFLPLSWLSPTILLFTGALYALLTRATAVSAAVIATLAIGADKKAGPRYQGRLMIGGLVLMLLGFVVCGAVHLDMGYSSADVATNAKTGGTALDGWARAERSQYEFFTAERGHQAVGLSAGTALLWACSRFPSWPIHPIGILFCRYSLGHLLWFSVFVGWLIKAGVTNLFGGGVYRRARPFFLGLILGELLAVIVWAIVPVVIMAVTGADALDVPRYMLLRYP